MRDKPDNLGSEKKKKKAESTEIKLWKAYQDYVLLILCLNAVHRAADRRNIGQFPLEPVQILPNVLASSSSIHRSHSGEVYTSTSTLLGKKKVPYHCSSLTFPV